MIKPIFSFLGSLFCLALINFAFCACDGDYQGDPGIGPFVPVPDTRLADECGLDADLLNMADPVIGTDYMVVRYGKLCHQYLTKGIDEVSAAWSVTKTLGAVVTGAAAYETRDLPRTGRKTGPISDTDRVDHWLDHFSYNQDALIAHVLAMVAHNKDLDNGNLRFTYDIWGTVQVNSLNDIVNQAIAQDPVRLGHNIEEFTQRYVYLPLGMISSIWSNDRPNKIYGYTWYTTMSDMARIGLLILHGGMYNGKRVLDESWAYRMTHPSFEEANTGYGYLTWLNTRGGGTGVGGDFISGAVEYDLCAPPAMWNSYPHFPSTYPDCKSDPGYSCEQKYDVGVWCAKGSGGQYIIGHPGLDLLIVAKKYHGGGPAALWKAIRPALVAKDPKYAGDEAAFCAAYGSSNYAPDLFTQPEP